ncbi:transmembrane protein 54 isoform X1 [Vidua macroura]|uniref:transmembrane protein 54 isoform X1 n=1 Tax=Vidua macroura TaxID=187451 RepID=UPI0023A8969A|nr:transmembrane protein 54 isoform X1 [Vidua macroura]
MCQVGHLDPSSHRNVLMKTGLILLIVGHLNFITGALVHGTVLRFVVAARDATSLHYGVTNSASVIAALLTISCGVSALLLSRYPGPAALKWALLALSACSSLSCLCCLLGLLVAIGLTLGNQGQVLLAPCSIANSALTPVSRECPFDPTRVYSSTLSLWAISLLLEAMGIFFSIRCLLLTLELLRLGRCCRGTLRMKVISAAWAQLHPLCCRAGTDQAGPRGDLWILGFHPSAPILILLSAFQVSLQEAPVQSPGPGQCLALLRLDSGEIARL